MPRKANTDGDHYYDPFPSTLRKLMREKNVRQAELSEVLGLGSRQAVTKYIDGSSSPTGDKLIALAKFFGVSTDYLLGLTENKTPSTEKRAICEYTGLNEKTIDRIHGYTTSHEDHTFNRKVLNIILGDSELYAVLQATKRAIKASEISKSCEKEPPITSETDFSLQDEKSGTVIVPASIAQDFFTRYAEEELHEIISDVVKECTSETESSSGGD